MRIGVVVVTWNSADVIGECLDACGSFEELDVVVVDNASSDNTCEVVRRRPGVRLIANADNRGFAAAANHGIEELDSAAVLLLNPDAVPLSGLRELAEAACAEGVGAAGGTLLDTEGKRQDGFNVRGFPTPATLAFESLGLNRLLPWNPVNRKYRRRVTTATDVDQPAGAFLMIRREAWRAVGGFDQSFWPAWFEDVDFCLRMRDAGFRIVYVPEARARHVGGHSASRLSWPKRQLFWYGSLLRYSGKHFTAGGRRVVSGAVMLACVPRAIAAMVTQGGLAAADVYSRVFRLALEYWHEPVPPQPLRCEWIVREGETRPQ
jgi:N-acetylglucosaminyl-diphospho-decaprenol L-rhamnosyltransferase